MICKDDLDLVKNPDLYRFVVYLKQRGPATDVSVEQKLQNLIADMETIRFHQLEQCGADVLKEYLTAIRKQEDAAETLLHYMELKQK